MSYKIWYTCEAEKVTKVHSKGKSGSSIHVYGLIFAASKKEAEKDFRWKYNLTQGEHVTVKMLTTNSEEEE